MRFVVYMLKFPSGFLYTGSTGNFERRVRAHKKLKVMDGVIVHQETFQTREDALQREKQIKGWTRAKKDSLIAGKLAQLVTLSKRRGGKPIPSSPPGPKAWPEVPAATS